MSAEKKQPTRRSVKKQTEKARAKQAKKAQAKEVARPKQGNLPPEKAVVNNPIAKKSKKRGGRKTVGDTSTRLRWPQIILVALIVVVIALAALFAWDRWFRYDDAKDIQGEWVFTSEGNSVPVDINADRIAFSADVKFPYKMDTWGKTIEFNFTDLSGKGFYRFSLDRQTLYIAEDTNEDIIGSIQISLGLKEPTEDLDLSKTTILTKQGSSSANALLNANTPSGGTSDGSVTGDDSASEGDTQDPSGENTNADALDISAPEDVGGSEGE